MSSEHGSRRWIEETVNAGEGYKTAIAVGSVRDVDSSQSLLICESDAFGRVMMLDGAIQLTEADEFIYHEMMAHVPLFEHGAAARVLIVGGGDGGIAREVLRHKSVRALSLVEIDPAVIALAKAEFPAICGGAFDDPRLTVTIADGARFVRESRDAFDVIIVDSPDPVGAGAVLFEDAFYRACRKRLAPGGLMVTQSGMPFLTPQWFASHAANLQAVFAGTRFFLSTVPSYSGGPMAHGLVRANARGAVDAGTIASRAERSRIAMRYWTPALHQGAFALPAYIEAMTRPAAWHRP